MNYFQKEYSASLYYFLENLGIFEFEFLPNIIPVNQNKVYI